MNSIKLIAFALMGVFAASVLVPQTADASPSEVSASKKKKTVKKSKKKKNTRVVQAAPIVDQRALCFSQANDSAYSFFHCERMHSVTTTFASQDKSYKQQTVVKSSFKTNNNNNIINEASKMEGLDARKNRVALKTYMNVDRNGPVDPVKIPWCAGFANAVLNRAGFTGTESLMARSFLNYGEKTLKPVKGDIVVLKRGRSSRTGHVGFFNGYEWQGSQLYVKVLGGNQNKAVTIAYFPTNLVISYRRPV
jgi:uncharacterized protein (TIGR02594 family)